MTNQNFTPDSSFIEEAVKKIRENARENFEAQ